MTKAQTSTRAMTVAGIMSGTSADGIDVALVRIRPGFDGLKLRLLAHHAVPYSASVRKAALDAMDAQQTSTAELARLNWHLGMAYGEALRATLARYPGKIQLVGCHGQTIYHQGAALPYAGKRMACTWQIGEMAILASEARVPVVSNFRPADMVAGGQGAPLVSLLDYVMFRHRSRHRVLQNLGGIGNLTAIAAGATLGDVLAFDTGPANMVIDALMQVLFQKQFDRGGAMAARGVVLSSVLKSTMRHPFFRKRPPKSAGREEFGRGFADDFLKQCRALSDRGEDAIATATALTAKTVGASYERFVKPRTESGRTDYLVSGGGAKNKTLMRMLQQELGSHGCEVKTIESAGVPAEAKEAVAFALLAYETWHERPGNVPAATGAKHPAILGQITYV